MNCFNGERYLRQAIDSVLKQRYQNWEIIFWDNQSTDNSAKIFKEYSDPRLKYYRAKKHTWLYEARNYAIERASGELIAFLDVDDQWASDKLEKQIPFFSDSEIGIVCGNYWLKDENKERTWIAVKSSIPSGWVLNELLKNYFVGLLTLVVRRSALESLEYPCNPNYHIIGDLDLVIRLSCEWKMGCVQEPIGICRKHENNELNKHRVRHANELEKWIQEMEKIEIIRSSPNFCFVKSSFLYHKAMTQVLMGNKLGALRLSHDLPLGYLKLRLLCVIVLPSYFILKLKK
jgi:glycosyltransferase involved in cell wall biosynthesis